MHARLIHRHRNPVPPAALAGERPSDADPPRWFRRVSQLGHATDEPLPAKLYNEGDIIVQLIFAD